MGWIPWIRDENQILFSLVLLLGSSIVNRGEWLWNPTKFFVACFCSLCWPSPCTKHNSCLLGTEELTNKNVLITLLMHSVWTQNKRLCTVVDLPTWILASLFAPLMLAGLHNQSPLLTMVYHISRTPCFGTFHLLRMEAILAHKRPCLHCNRKP